MVSRGAIPRVQSGMGIWDWHTDAAGIPSIINTMIYLSSIGIQVGTKVSSREQVAGGR